MINFIDKNNVPTHYNTIFRRYKHVYTRMAYYL